jgi:hypothetical protein
MRDHAAVSADEFAALDGLEPDGRADPERIDQDAAVVEVGEHRGPERTDAINVCGVDGDLVRLRRGGPRRGSSPGRHR